MKKYTKMAYISLILVIVLCVFSIYKVFAESQKENEDIKSKSLEEVKLLESKFLNLFNELNSIKFENYKISTSKIKQEKSSSKESSQGQGNSSGNSEGENSEQSGNQGESSSSENSEQSNSEESSSDNKSYNLEESGILTNETEINWKQIKNDVENLYTPLYKMTVDLYQTNTNQQDIMNFNKEYDNLTKAVKDEDKEVTLDELAILYNYLPKFLQNCTEKEKEITIIKTKQYILNAYSLIEKEEWSTISENINIAAQEFRKLVTNINNDEKNNQYNINKAYIMINEMQNAVLLRDRDVFLIKYKNVLEELQNI